MQVGIMIGKGCLAVAATGFIALTAFAHPGSGIVVDEAGRVYFVHTRVGVLSTSTGGELKRLDGPAWHFLIADPGARFAEQRWTRFPDGEIRATGPKPALLRASSFPLAMNSDGALFYPDPKADGHVHIMRVEPGETPVDYVTLPPIIEIGPEGDEIRATWIHGLAAGSDGTLYYTEQNAIRRIDPGGEISVVAADIDVPDCKRPPAFTDGRDVAFLRGLDVTDDGTVYAAASGCSAVIKITPGGALSVAMRSEQPWSPTGVAVSGGDVYALEFGYIDVEDAADWLPRVRKLASDGSVITIATITERPD